MSANGGTSLGTADIIGIVVGGVLALVTIIGIIMSCYAMCGKKNNQPKIHPSPQYNNQQNPYGQPTNTGYYSQQHRPPQEPHWGPPPPDYAPQQPYYPSKSTY